MVPLLYFMVIINASFLGCLKESWHKLLEFAFISMSPVNLIIKVVNQRALVDRDFR